MNTDWRANNLIILFVLSAAFLGLITLLVFAGGQGARAETGLVASWHFDEGSGTAAADSSGNGNNGVINGATWTNGISGGALNFDGLDDRVSVPAISGLTAVQTRTAWIKPSTISGSPNLYILDEGGNNNWIQLFDVDSDGLLEVRAGGTGNSTLGYVNGQFEFTRAETWYFVAVTVDGSGLLKIYVNGNLDVSGTVAIPAPSSIYIGAYNGSAYHSFNGLIDEVKLYNRTLFASEILAEYRQYAPATQNNTGAPVTPAEPGKGTPFTFPAWSNPSLPPLPPLSFLQHPAAFFIMWLFAVMIGSAIYVNRANKYLNVGAGASVGAGADASAAAITTTAAGADVGTATVTAIDASAAGRSANWSRGAGYGASVGIFFSCIPWSIVTILSDRVDFASLILGVVENLICGAASGLVYARKFAETGSHENTGRSSAVYAGLYLAGILPIALSPQYFGAGGGAGGRWILIFVFNFLSLFSFATLVRISWLHGADEQSKEHTSLGLGYLSNGNFEEAVMHFDRALELEPDSIEHLNNKAIALLKSGKFDEAMACFDRALEIDPDNVEILNNKGILLLKNGSFEDAMACFDRALERNANDDSAWNNKGLATLEYKGLDDSLRALDLSDVIKKTAKSVNIAVYAGGGLALGVVLGILSFSPIRFMSFSILGIFLGAVIGILRVQQELKEKKKTITNQITLAVTASWNTEGIRMLQHGNFEEAERCFDRALDINPNSDVAWSNKAMLLFKEGKAEDALVCLDRAININPKNETVLYNKGLTLRSLGRHEEQIKAFDAALKINPGYKDALINKGWALYKLDKCEEALECMNSVLEIDPYDQLALKIKADCEEKLGGNAKDYA